VGPTSTGKVADRFGILTGRTRQDFHPNVRDSPTGRLQSEGRYLMNFGDTFRMERLNRRVWTFFVAAQEDFRRLERTGNAVERRFASQSR